MFSIIMNEKRRSLAAPMDRQRLLFSGCKKVGLWRISVAIEQPLRLVLVLRVNDNELVQKLFNFASTIEGLLQVLARATAGSGEEHHQRLPLLLCSSLAVARLRRLCEVGRNLLVEVFSGLIVPEAEFGLRVCCCEDDKNDQCGPFEAAPFPTGRSSAVFCLWRWQLLISSIGLNRRRRCSGSR